VALLAALDRIGIAPERAAHPLSLGLTVALWGLVAWFAWRTRPAGREWLAVIPVLFLAATRSIAVWSSGGLETRLFEVLALGAVLRLVVEIEPARTGTGSRAALAPWLFAFATLTRPDGLLISGCAFGAAAFLLLRSGRERLMRFVRGWAPFLALVGAHFVFRRLYYHEWLPNTYYAKVGGRLWWDSGLRYVSAAALEYAAWLWLPLLAAAVLHHRRRGTGFVPLLFAAAVVPHLAYVTAIGGDHFEYRPLDLYFPLIFLLLYDGAKAWAAGERDATASAASTARGWAARARPAAALVGVGLVLVGLFELPHQSHRQFPGWYVAGFPGRTDEWDPTAQGYLLPQRDPLYRAPGLRSIAAAHRALLVSLTAQFVGIRQEEHRLFLETVVAEGRRLRALIEQGLLPRDFHFATDCVGAVPYLSDARVLDRLGLTDATVAHSPFVQQLMAHGKYATLDYARSRGVDLWAVDPVHFLCPLVSPRLFLNVRAVIESTWTVYSPGRTYAADIGDGYLLLGELPQGVEQARTRFPRLEFERLDDPAFLDTFIARSMPAYREWLREHPGDVDAAYRLGYIYLVGGQYGPALSIYRRLAGLMPDNAGVLEELSMCQRALGDFEGAAASLERAIALAAAGGDESQARRLREVLQEVRRRGAQPARPPQP